MKTMTMPIKVPYPTAPELSLLLRLGPCRVRIAPVDADAWLSGTYEDPSDVLPLEVRADGGTAVVAQRFDLGAGIGVVSAPVLDLQIGRSRPFTLRLEVGAGDHALDLGGLPITALKVNAGAGRYTMDFSAPNTAEMATFEIAAGAGEVTARNIANANATDVKVSGGLGRCVLDFGGTLRRSMHARVDAGLAGVEMSVPAATSLKVTAKAFAGSTDIVGPLTKQGDAIYTAAGLAGTTPMLVAETSIAFGSVLIRAV